MAWVACNNSGQEIIFRNKPLRHFCLPSWIANDISENRYVVVPDGSIKKLIGRELTWEDEPVELEEN